MDIIVDTRPLWVILLGRSTRLLRIGVGVGAYWAISSMPTPEGLNPEGQQALAVFALCVSFWVLNVLPLMITSLMAIALIPLSGVMSSAQAYAFFGNSAVFFILGAFILAACIMKSGLSTRLSLIFLKRFGRTPTTLLVSIFLLNAFMAFWMSEHAVAAMNFPIIVEIVAVLGLRPFRSNYGKALFIAMAWGSTIGGVPSVLHRMVNGFQQSLIVLQVCDADLQGFPAHGVHGAEVQADLPRVGDVHQIDAPRSGLVGVAALGVAWIYDGGTLLSHHLACVDVAQRPVVEFRALQVFQSAGGVIGVAGVRAYICVDEANGRSLASRSSELRNQVMTHLPLRVANTIAYRPVRVVWEYGHSFDRRAKSDCSFWERQVGLPTIQRVVVSVADERAYVRLVQTTQAINKFQLRAEAVVRAVEHITRHQQGVHLLGYAQIDYVLVGVERGVSETLADLGLNLGHSLEGAVQVQVCGMNEPDY